MNFTCLLKNFLDGKKLRLKHWDEGFYIKFDSKYGDFTDNRGRRVVFDQYWIGDKPEWEVFVPKIKFSGILVGQKFKYRECTYIKIHYCEYQGKEYNFLNLSNGSAGYWNPESEVEILEE